MHIVILSRSEALFSTKALIQACRDAKYAVSVIDPTECEMTIENNSPHIWHRGIKLENIDGLIPRIGSSNTKYGANILRHFEAMGIRTIVSSKGLLQSRDKWLSFQILVQNKVPVPNTVFASGFNYEEQIRGFGNKPVIIKLLEGTHGEGVILSKNKANAISTAEALRTVGVDFLFQEFIQESKGTDIRIVVIDGEVVAAMKRISQKEEFRSNLHQGGRAEKVILTKEEESVAIKAAQAFNLNFCGIDLLRSKRGPLVLEVNSSAGLEGIQAVTNVNISAKIIAFFNKY